MYHYRPQRKAARQAPSREPVPLAVRRASREHGAAEEIAPARTDEQSSSIVPSEGKDSTGASLSLTSRDLQLLLFILSLMRQQEEMEHANPAEEETTIVVESAPLVREEDEEHANWPVPPPRRRRIVPLVLVAAGLLCLGVLFALLAQSLLAQTVSVTITPAQQTVTTTASIQVVTATTARTGQQIAGRWLPTLTLSQARRVSTSGIGHQPAQVARGTLTFYNAALTSQTIAAGTLLTGSDGVVVVTEQTAVVPAAALPTDGQASVAAQAVQTGPLGNIRSGDLYGPCCRANVFVENTAFTGGQDARSYPMVTQHDIDGVLASLQPALVQSIQAAYRAQLAATETLVTPIACTPIIKSSHRVGEEASQLAITLEETCTGIAYNQPALHALLLQVMAKQALAQLGRGYSLQGDLDITVQHAGTLDHEPTDTITLSVQSAGTWVYQFSEAQLQHLTALLAGKSRQQATELVRQVPGVSQVTMSSDTLPADPRHIRMLVLYRSN